MEQTSYIIKLYLSANTTSQQELLRLLNLLLPKKMNKTILKQYQFSAEGIDIESTIFFTPFSKWKRLLPTTELTPYFYIAQDAGFYFDYLTIAPFTVFTLIIPQELFERKQVKIVKLIQNVFVQQNGYLGFLCSLQEFCSKIAACSVGEYAELQHQKYLAFSLDKKNIYKELANLFCGQNMCKFTWWNSCDLPQYGELLSTNKDVQITTITSAHYQLRCT